MGGFGTTLSASRTWGSCMQAFVACVPRVQWLSTDSTGLGLEKSAALCELRADLLAAAFVMPRHFPVFRRRIS